MNASLTHEHSMRSLPRRDARAYHTQVNCACSLCRHGSDIAVHESVSPLVRFFIRFSDWQSYDGEVVSFDPPRSCHENCVFRNLNPTRSAGNEKTRKTTFPFLPFVATRVNRAAHFPFEREQAG